MEGKSHVCTPMSTSVKISIDPIDKSIDHTLYRNMIFSLLYILASRPNIAFSVGACVRFQANCKKAHLTSVKRIINYLSITIDYGIWYSKDNNLTLVDYSNVDWIRNANDGNSIF